MLLWNHKIWRVRLQPVHWRILRDRSRSFARHNIGCLNIWEYVLESWLHKVMNRLGGQGLSSLRIYKSFTLFVLWYRNEGTWLWRETKNKSMYLGWIHVSCFVTCVFYKCWSHMKNMKVVMYLFIYVRSHIWVKIYLFTYVS